MIFNLPHSPGLSLRAFVHPLTFWTASYSSWKDKVMQWDLWKNKRPAAGGEGAKEDSEKSKENPAANEAWSDQLQF